MLIENVKIFETGNYPQGNFPEEKVIEIFSNLKGPVKGQFAHSSKWENPEDAVDVGEFSNFKLNEGVISADIDFNEKGESYYNDGIIKGVSVEIGDNTISKIACLPLGVSPAISGAEFEEKGILEFGAEIFEDVKSKEDPEDTKEFQLDMIIEELKGLDITEENKQMLYSLVDILWEKIDEKEMIEKMEKKGYMITKEFEKPLKTPEQIEKEIEERLIKKYDAEKIGKLEFEEFKKVGKITPAMEEAGINEDFFKILNFNKNNSLEFEESKINVSIIKAIFDNMPNIVNMKSITKTNEFCKTEEKTGIYEIVQKRINDIRGN